MATVTLLAAHVNFGSTLRASLGRQPPLTGWLFCLLFCFRPLLRLQTLTPRCVRLHGRALRVNATCGIRRLSADRTKSCRCRRIYRNRLFVLVRHDSRFNQPSETLSHRRRHFGLLPERRRMCNLGPRSVSRRSSVPPSKCADSFSARTNTIRPL